MQQVGPKLLKLYTGNYENDQKMWACISVIFNEHVGTEKCVQNFDKSLVESHMGRTGKDGVQLLLL